MSTAVLPPDATRKRQAPVQDLDEPFTLTPPDKLTAKQLADYIACGGTKCPICGSSNIIGEQFDVIEGKCWQPITCQECDATWNDEYDLTRVTDMIFGTKSNDGGQAIETIELT